jgi:transposase InsO family protein
MSEAAKYANMIWELDGTPADLLCADGKRYMILGAIDVYSRRVVYSVEEKSNSYAIARLLRKAILRLGVPEQVVIDNGRDYTSNHFNSICLHLGIDQKIVAPFSGDLKPHIERSFRTLSEMFEELSGYSGHSVAEKMAIKSRKSYEDRQKSIEKWRAEQKLGKEEAKKIWIAKENDGQIIEVKYSAEQLQQIIDAWVAQIYETRIHSGKNMSLSPLEKWAKTPAPPKTIENERTLDLLLGESATRMVGKEGIRSFRAPADRFVRRVQSVSRRQARLARLCNSRFWRVLPSRLRGRADPFAFWFYGGKKTAGWRQSAY